MQSSHHLKYADVTKKIIGCAMKVHSYFGPGFPEVIYQRALLLELRNSQLQVESEVELTVMYYDVPVGKRRVDLIVGQRVLIELKALAQIDLGAYNQVLNCLNVFNLEVGLLLNFGKDKLEFKRFVRALR